MKPTLKTLLLLTAFLVVACDLEAQVEFEKPLLGRVAEIGEDGIKVVFGEEVEFQSKVSLQVLRGQAWMGRMIVTGKTDAENTIVGKYQCPFDWESQETGRELRLGDTVFFDSTAKFVDHLSAYGGDNLAKWAERYAREDQELGVCRLLYYGQPRLIAYFIDKPTGLQMYPVAGCMVDEDVESFVNSYNELVKANRETDD